MYGKDIQRSFLLQGLVIGLVIPMATCLVCAPWAYVSNNPQLTTTETFVALAVPIGLFLLVAGGGTLAATTFTGRRRRRWLDEAFTQFGLTAVPLGFGRLRYEGEFDEREINITFQRGPWIEWQVATSMSGKFGITQNDSASTKLGGLVNKEPTKIKDPDMGDVAVFADDEKGIRRLLKDPEVKAAVRDLLFHDSEFLIRQVLLQDGQLIFRLYRIKTLFQFDITPDEAERWMDELLTIADTGETILR